MPIYETLSIIHPELPETRVKEIIAWMQRIMEGAEGTVLRVDEWGMRDLAYRIKKQQRGYYVLLETDAPPSALKELERNLRLSEDVLRFLSVVYPTPSDGHAPPQSATPAPETSAPISSEDVSSEPGPEAQ